MRQRMGLCWEAPYRKPHICTFVFTETNQNETLIIELELGK